mmetsp:Transcript_26184/g.74986  ORF Transcript_26184/g.74986 Transcript_26184/m.74986 type:complete len:320 (+) Transcript_26184:400-1359(+)
MNLLVASPAFGETVILVVVIVILTPFAVNIGVHGLVVIDEERGIEGEQVSAGHARVLVASLPRGFLAVGLDLCQSLGLFPNLPGLEGRERDWRPTWWQSGTLFLDDFLDSPFIGCYFEVDVGLAPKHRIAALRIAHPENLIVRFDEQKQRQIIELVLVLVLQSVDDWMPTKFGHANALRIREPNGVSYALDDFLSQRFFQLHACCQRVLLELLRLLLRYWVESFPLSVGVQVEQGVQERGLCKILMLAILLFSPRILNSAFGGALGIGSDRLNVLLDHLALVLVLHAEGFVDGYFLLLRLPLFIYDLGRHGANSENLPL